MPGGRPKKKNKDARIPRTAPVNAGPRDLAAPKPDAPPAEALSRALMLRLYAGQVPGHSPRERLRNALIAVGRYARDLQRPAQAGPEAAGAAPGRALALFSGSTFTEHVKLVAVLAGECRPHCALKTHSIPFLVDALIAVMVFPQAMRQTLEGTPLKLKAMEEETFSDEGIAVRADIALRGIGL